MLPEKKDVIIEIISSLFTNMLDSLLSFFYILLCIVLIAAVILQHYRSDQSKGSSSYFGGAGHKHFLYRVTFYAIGLFFIFAIFKTAIHQHQYQKSLPVKDLPPVSIEPQKNIFEQPSA